jgi:Protein of unknown function (DUF1344)
MEVAFRASSNSEKIMRVGEKIMRMVAGVVAAATLMSASLAYAASTTGEIQSLNRNQHTFTLDNGATFIAPRTAKLSNFKVGENVAVGYSMRGASLGAIHASSIAPAQPAVNNG